MQCRTNCKLPVFCERLQNCGFCTSEIEKRRTYFMLHVREDNTKTTAVVCVAKFINPRLNQSLFALRKPRLRLGWAKAEILRVCHAIGWSHFEGVSGLLKIIHSFFQRGFA